MCVACVAVAAALPAAAPVADRAARTVNAAVHLAVDFSAIDGFSAIPIIQSALSDGDLGELLALGPVDGIPALAKFAGDGDLADFEPAADGSGGYAALSGLNSYATGNLGGIDAFSALGNPLGTDAFSAIPVFTGPDGVLTGGGVKALGGYAALSAIDTFVGDNNGGGGVFTGGGINALAPDADGNGGYAALSALPVFAGTDANGKGTGVLNGGGINALSGYAALSAIPAYLAPSTPAATDDTSTESPNLKVASTQAAASTTPADPTAKAKSTTKQSTQSYSASFAPKQVVLFGSGGGKNAADNGIRGWGGMLKKLGIGGSGSDGSDAGSGKSGGGKSAG